MSAKSFHAEFAWLGGREIASDVLIETEEDRITKVTPGTTPLPGAKRLRGLTLPGLINTHSHVFHRAIRGHTQMSDPDFWAWRDTMYGVAMRLDPDMLYQLALATYTEMALAGITTVGEFHYLHHAQDGTRYSDQNLMGRTVIQAANDAGLRITLLDTCYLQADIHGASLAGVQRRFDDGHWQGWMERVDDLVDSPMARIGAAIHSVRAVPREAFRPIRDYAERRKLPLHVHLSEQIAENAASIEAHGCTPTELLDNEGVMGEATTAVHATHLTERDIEILGSSGTTISMCCTTERDLADGIGPAIQLARAGSPLCVGSDAQMMIDLWEEARAIEMNERLISGKRGHLRADQLLTSLTQSGANSLGWNSGRLEQGMLADFVTVDMASPRTAGAFTGDPLSHVVFAATSADISNVFVGGVSVVEAGRHQSISQPGNLLESAIAAVFP
ncbi:MAG: formimidoylglutamate deiminase [Acidimicrobiia bacterium]|nr:formimidoylglutamate deiminase [Acidimicrobiia bacterium]